MRTKQRPPPVDGRQQHKDWLSLVELTGPFLSLPVLVRVWPTLDPLDVGQRDRLRQEHSAWQRDPSDARAWIRFVLRELLKWGDALLDDSLPDDWITHVPEHEATIRPSFALTDPESGEPRLFGLVLPPGQAPGARLPGEAWVASPVDRLAVLCRKRNVPLGLVTDGRWWALVWAPAGVTTSVLFDSATWADAADRDVVRAFVSLLCRKRFLSVPDTDTLPALLTASLDVQEETTEALGVQVRRAVELLVEAFGRLDVKTRETGTAGLSDVDARTVYRASVTVMMRVVFLLFAEERRLLPADNELYLRSYSVGRLCTELENRRDTDSEEALEYSTAAWHRLLALSNALNSGVDHLRLTLPAYDGPLFDPTRYPWFNRFAVDDRTVLHMLLAVQYVETGTGRNRERRRLSFRALDVEDIGYVYEGLMSFEGFRAIGPVLGLIGKQGLEAEVELAEMEKLADRRSTAQLAELLVKKFKSSKIGTLGALAQKLAPLSELDRVEAKRRLLAATDNNHEVAERALPFYGILRTDLRGLPMVINDGGLYVTESHAYTGAHYTPRFLAEKVVEGALEPLVYSPGPLQTDDTSKWKLKSSKEILGLRVADITMGSGAFLVAACRYLAMMLVKAWTEEGALPELSSVTGVIDAESDPLILKARQKIIEHCLYGVDINPMSVDVAMAKLSLWLVSTGKSGPFTFLEDKFVVGDSLLGITSLDQLEYLHLNPKRGKEIHESSLFDLTASARAAVAEIAEIRRVLVEAKDHETRARLWEKAKHLIQQAKPLADLTVGAALAHASNPDKGSLRAADLLRRTSDRVPGAEDTARGQAEAWLNTDLPEGAQDRKPAHWPLEFADVFQDKGSGFDAVIGNPPFLGGSKISGACGGVYKSYLVHIVAGGRAGNSDLVGYFVLRAHDLLSSVGQTGLLATNSLAQGVTRRVSLDFVISSGCTIRMSIKSEQWPSKSAELRYCAVWSSRYRIHDGVPCIADGQLVGRIGSDLDVADDNDRKPFPLKENEGLCSEGVKITGIGFTLDRSDAVKLIERDSRNGDVLRPFLSGDDVNNRSDLASERWVIDFRDWPEERAAGYIDCYQRVVELVRPERLRLKAKLDREYWWRFTRRRPRMVSVLQKLSRCLVLTRHSKSVMPVFVPADQVLSDALTVFVSADAAWLALLSSAVHYKWAVKYGSSIKGDLRYTPTAVFETLPRPKLTENLLELGERLDGVRRQLMLERRAGITATYNRVHDSDCQDEAIVELRQIHKEIDYAVVRAYGWLDLVESGLDHDFHQTREGVRYTVGPMVWQKILDRLLEENLRRYAEEKAQGLHDKAGKKNRAADEDAATLF